jgi:hypothetical protein
MPEYKFKYLILILFSALASGCEVLANAVPTIPDVINKNKFEGNNIQVAYAEYGKPAQLVKNAGGESVARWFFESQYSLTDTANTVSAGPAGGVMLTPTSSTKYYDKKCTLEITFNAQNMVTDYKTIKNSPGSCNKWF